MRRLAALAALSLAACVDYGLSAGPDRERPGDTDPDTAAILDPDTAPDPGDPDTEAPPHEIPVEEDFVSCADVGLWVDQWWGSMPFSHSEALRDGAGRPYWDPNFELRDFSTVQIPERGQPSPGYDKVYIVRLWLDAVGPEIWLDLQSDDGLTVHVNGTLVGEWGGGWQEEGCVNDDANCTTFVYAPPPNVTHLLHVGENVLAARLSNAIDGAYMGLSPRCTED